MITGAYTCQRQQNVSLTTTPRPPGGRFPRNSTRYINKTSDHAPTYSHPSPVFYLHFFQSPPPTPTTYINGGSLNGYPPFFCLKMLSKKLNVNSSTAFHAITASFCLLGFVIVGIFIAKEIAEKANTASKRSASLPVHLFRVETYK